MKQVNPFKDACSADPRKLMHAEGQTRSDLYAHISQSIQSNPRNVVGVCYFPGISSVIGSPLFRAQPPF